MPRMPFATVGTACALVVGCSSAATAVGAPGDPPPPSATCRWSVAGPLIPLSDPPADRRHLLLAAAPTPDGALVAWRVIASPTSRDPIEVRRFYADGTLHPWSAPGRASRATVATGLNVVTQFSLWWDAAHDGAAMLHGGPPAYVPCSFVSFRGDDTGRAQVIDVALLGGDIRATCESLGPAPAGWSFLTGGGEGDGWVDQLVTLSGDGELRGPPTPLPPRGRAVGTDRAARLQRSEVSGGFVVTWVGDTGVGEERRLPLHVQRYDASGTPRGDDHVVEPDNTTLISDSQVVETPSGLLVLWQQTALPSQFDSRIATRRLRADGSPAATTVVVFEGAVWEGMHAAVRGADVIIAKPTPVNSAEGGSLGVLILDHHGQPRGEAIEIPLPEPRGNVTLARVIPTAAGALIVFNLVGSGSVNTRVMAAALACRP